MSETFFPAEQKIIDLFGQSPDSKYVECEISDWLTAIRLEARGYLRIQPDASSASENFKVYRGPKLRHQGVNTRRLIDNPAERIFAEAWTTEADQTLPYILCGSGDDVVEVSLRDQTVAATIIQWLGSPVGRAFVDDVRQRIQAAGR